MHRSFLPCFALLSAGLIVQSASAATITVSDQTPNGGRTLTTTAGSVSAPPLIPTTTYTITGLDLTSEGGTASETIAFDVTYTQTGGTGVQFNGFGNVSVTGGDNNQIDLGETLTATISLNAGLTTFAGTIDLGFILAQPGGVSSDESWNVIHENGTIAATQTNGNNPATFASSSFFTLETTDGEQLFDRINLQRFTVEINANEVPEPGSLALVGLGGLCLLRRRRPQ